MEGVWHADFKGRWFMMRKIVSLQWKVGRLPGIFFYVTCLHGAICIICFVPFFASAPVFYALNFEGPKINVLLTPPVRQMSMSDCQNGGAKKNKKCRRSVDVGCVCHLYISVVCVFLLQVDSWDDTFSTSPVFVLLVHQIEADSYCETTISMQFKGKKLWP